LTGAEKACIKRRRRNIWSTKEEDALHRNAADAMADETGRSTRVPSDLWPLHGTKGIPTESSTCALGVKDAN